MSPSTRDESQKRPPIIQALTGRDLCSQMVGTDSFNIRTPGSSSTPRDIAFRLSAHVDTISPRRLMLAAILYDPYAEVTIGIITLFNFALILIDTDVRASGVRTPTWLVVLQLMCLASFTLELGIRFYVERRKIVDSAWNWLDIVVVFSGILGEVMQALDVKVISLSFLRVFRCFRLLRIMKAFVLMNHLTELRKLIRGFTSCLKTLLWSALLVFLFMTTWSTLAVELLHPLMEEIGSATPMWDDIPRCVRSFSSVMASNLTFFQTIIAGDSWGLVAIPVIEQHPWAAFIFVGSLFTLVVGILNLIIAVLVDTAAEARAKDTAARAAEAQSMESEEKKMLEKIFSQVDLDSSGGITFNELQEGAENVQEFKQKLRVMDIRGDDLHELFSMLDEDGSGEIDPEEFIETLYRMKCGDDKAASTFTKRYVMHIKHNQSALAEKVMEVEIQLNDLRGYISTEIAGLLRSLGSDPTRVSSSVSCDDITAVQSEPFSPTHRNGRRRHTTAISQEKWSKLRTKLGALSAFRSTSDLLVSGRSTSGDLDADLCHADSDIATAEDLPPLTPDVEPRPLPAMSMAHNESLLSQAAAAFTPRTEPESNRSPRPHPSTPRQNSSQPQCLVSTPRLALHDHSVASLEQMFLHEQLMDILAQAEKDASSEVRRIIDAELGLCKLQLCELCRQHRRSERKSARKSGAFHHKPKDKCAGDDDAEELSQVAEVLSSIQGSLDERIMLAVSQIMQPIRAWQDCAK